MTNNVKDIVKSFGIKMTKSLGQNFLNDTGIISGIVDCADVDKSDLVIEVGPGIGSMTTELGERAGRVVAVEIDKHLMEALAHTLSPYPNVSVINKDIMQTDINALIEEFGQKEDGSRYSAVKAVANLPYYITTPIVMKFLEDNPGIKTMVFMVQKEVAERMVAAPGKKDYGALSVAVQFYSRARIMMEVPPHCFIPQPEVNSSVVRLDIYETPFYEVADKKIFFRLVRAAFEQRRKTLVNAIFNTGGFMLSKEEIGKIFTSIGLADKVRGEALSIPQFAALANEIAKLKK